MTVNLTSHYIAHAYETSADPADCSHSCTSWTQSTWNLVRITK